jgi:predicted metalloprotease
MSVSRGVIGGGIGTVILVVAALFFGIDPTTILQQIPNGGPPAVTTQQHQKPGADPLAEFVSVVLADTEDTWKDLFRRNGKTYQEPKLVLFSGAAQSACGFADAAVGPFYCPEDHKVYIDLRFYQDLKERFKAPGDFAQAYVIAHEIGHHVQNLLGITEQVQAAQRSANKVEANRLSVRTELQADCFAGIWAYHANRSRSILEEGDLEEALRAASAMGDDRIQRQSRGVVVPDSFTHGSSDQRVSWFKRGFETGDPGQCNTFKKAAYL